jgi:hypothetical protein
MISRRGLIVGGAALGWGSSAYAGEAPVAPLPLGLHVAGGDEPVVSEAWIAASLAAANRLLAPQSLAVVERWRRSLASPGVLENAADRDALGKLLVPGAINVFLVASLRDVDVPVLHRRGVRWRQRSNLQRSYLIVAASAHESTLCHELGHELGLPHSYVVDNVMSYKRENPERLTFDVAQGRIMRRTARGLWAQKRLLAPAG